MPANKKKTKRNNQRNKSNHWIRDNFLLPLIVTILGGVCLLFITNSINEKTLNPANSSETASELEPSANSFISMPVSLPESRDEVIIMSKPSYLQYLKSVTNGDILYYHYGDYDLDGNCEMFALVGQYVEPLIPDGDDNLCGTLWFINQNGAMEIDPEEKIFWSNPHLHNLKGYCFLTLEKAYVTGSESYIWGVKDGLPFQPNLIGYGNGISVNKYNEIEVIHSTYDACLVMLEDGTSMYLGHTWKKYYFYYDGKDFREYGGIVITYEDLLKVNGIKAILDKIENDGYSIDSIYYRSNNMININVSHSTESSVDYKNVTIRVFETTIEIVTNKETDTNEPDEIYEDGFYLSAYSYLLATYPEKFPY